MSFRPSLSPLLLVVAAVLMALTAPSTAVSQSPAIAITGVSGCSDVGSSTRNCSFHGATLTITGVGFVVDLQAEVAGGGLGSQCYIDFPSMTATRFTCALTTGRSVFSVNGAAEPLTIRFPSLAPAGQLGAYETAPFYGITFAQVPFPVINRIAGCDDSQNADGQYTAHCVPDTATITLTGPDFKLLDERVSGLPPLQLAVIIGGRASYGVVRVASDTTLEIAMMTTYNRLVVPDHYTGTPLTLSIGVGQGRSNNVSISFVSPVPPPQITSLTARGCQSRASNGLALSGCVPGISTITVNGQYFYRPLAVYIGGQPCVVTTAASAVTATAVVCTVPLIDQYVPGLYYDLMVNDTVYWDSPEVGVLTAAVSFIPGPILASAVPCIDTLRTDNWQYTKCQPGQSLTLIGTSFLPFDPLASVTLTIVGRNIAGNCTQLTPIDDQRIVCVLPDLGPLSRWASVRFTLYAWGNASNAMSLNPYDAVLPITVTSLSGCGDSNNTSVMRNGVLTISHCLPTDTLTINGANIVTSSTESPPALLTANGTQLFMAAQLYWSTNTMYGTLPRITDDTYWNTSMVYVVAGVTYSNPFAVVFGQLPNSDADNGNNGDDGRADSGGGLSGGAVAGIVIAAVVAAVLISAVLMWTCRQQRAKGASSYAPHSDVTRGGGEGPTATRSVELHGRL